MEDGSEERAPGTQPTGPGLHVETRTRRDTQRRVSSTVYPAQESRELGILLRISTGLDIIGDVSATVDSPAELIAWARILDQPSIAAWTAHDSEARFVHVSASHQRSPIHGRVTAVLPCAQHAEFWSALVGDRQIEPGTARKLSLADLAKAWEAMPITPPGVSMATPAPPGTNT